MLILQTIFYKSFLDIFLHCQSYHAVDKFQHAHMCITCIFPKLKLWVKGPCIAAPSSGWVCIFFMVLLVFVYFSVVYFMWFPRHFTTNLKVLCNMTKKGSCEWYKSIGLLRVYISTDFKFCFKGPFAKNSPERQTFVKKCKETGVKITLFPIDFIRITTLTFFPLCLRIDLTDSSVGGHSAKIPARGLILQFLRIPGCSPSVQCAQLSCF